MVADLKQPTLLFASITPESLVEGELLTLLDRCDYCGARALVRATKDSSEILFCAHDARKHAEALVNSGWSLNDQTYQAFEDNEKIS